MRTILLQMMLMVALGLLGTRAATYGQTGAAWQAIFQKEVDGFQVPECVVVDSRSGKVFVSNIEASPDKYWDDDKKGFISLLETDGTIKQLRWKNSAENAVINSPKGMCILRDQLVYTDNSRLMKVALSGDVAPVEIEIPDAVKLNDLATDGENIWVTDTGAGAVYRVDPMGKVQLAAEIEAVNGVTCHRGKVYAVSWELHEVYEVPSDGKGPPIPFHLAEHFQNLDGIEVLDDGCFIVSDFTGKKVALILPDRKTVSTLIEIESPADIGIDRKRGMLYVPGFMTDKVTVYKLKPSGLPSDKEPPADAKQPDSFLIPAYAFDRGNAKTFTTNWADAEPMIGFGGEAPVEVEYDIDFPITAQYTLNIEFAAAAERPVDLYLDGDLLGTCCLSQTETWKTSGTKWEKAKTLSLTKGKHTFRLKRDAAFPHIVNLRFDCSLPLPTGWELKRPLARTLSSPAPEPAYMKYAAGNVDAVALRRAIVDLTETFGSQYPHGAAYLDRLNELEIRLSQAKEKPEQLTNSNENKNELDQALVSLRREALLANPLLDFEKLLLIKRPSHSPTLGLPKNWQGNTSLPTSGFDDQIVILTLADLDDQLPRLFRPGGKFVGDVDLHFDGTKLMFSMPDEHGRWQVYEMQTDGSDLRQLTGEQPDVDSYDACYLPSGQIIFSSTACFTGTPCVYGDSHVANLYVMDGEGNSIRQLCFDQEHNWCPTVLSNGRILYTRWEYTGTPHSNTRLLFHMNPDGTEQTEYYGSNSYWPNSLFYARPIPGHPGKVISIVGGHHDDPRMGELVVFDTARGRREADGAVQRIPGHDKKVEPIIRDGLTKGSWPKFLHPFPLDEKYFLVSCKPTPQSLWGVYLVDVFDNLVLLKELPDFALLEPIPFRKTPTPPIIADRVDLTRTDSTVFISDVYAGQGLKGIPQGEVKSLRVFSYHYAFREMGGLFGVVGMDGPWDIKRVLGTVPVHEDGSAKFRVPANTPISFQPLDREGKAIQLMRSWTTAMPGETVSCVGCHQSPQAAPPSRLAMAQTLPPEDIEPWYGATRGFSYAREVQPVIDRHCVACHDGRPRPDSDAIPDLRGDQKLTDWQSITPGNGGVHAGKFSVGYSQLHRFVRRPGIESDYHILEPMEFHADTTELVQMLRKGHHNVKLDDEAWDRLITWIDMNCPYHGTWGEEIDDPGVQRQRRRELARLYSGNDDDPEAVPEIAKQRIKPLLPEPLPERETQVVECPNWPLSSAAAHRRQALTGSLTRNVVDLGNGVEMSMALIPAGEFVMGSLDGAGDESPLSRVPIEKPYWIGVCEVTNRQFNLYDSDHDSRIESKNAYQFGIHGYPVNLPEQPVVRVSLDEAQAFCQWLSKKTGKKFSVPTEAQWEYACRAGTDSPMFYGNLDSDFSKFANMADAKLSEFASDPYTVSTPLVNPTEFDDWIPKDSRFHDGALLSVAPGKYTANAWGLFDSHGNVGEWTRSTYRPYPYVATDGRNDGEPTGRKVVRGGSWRERPKRCTSSFRLNYQPYQRIYNVGFRVVCEADFENQLE